MPNKNEKKPVKKMNITIGKKGRFDPKKFIDTEPTLKEAKRNSIVISFGRMNPPTSGHEKLVNKVISESVKRKADSGIYLSHTQDKKKNPLSYEDKINFASKAFGKVIRKSPSKTIIQVAKELNGQYDTLVLVVGSDRVQEFETLLNKYNGKEYNFDNIEVVSAGDRDPDADDISGMSASKLRNLALEGKFEEFAGGLPNKLKSSAKKVYDSLRKGLGMNEEFTAEETLDEAPLSIQQRRRRGMQMRRLKSRLKIARKKAKRKMASKEKLQTRARRKARDIIKNRLSKKPYSDMSPPEKIALDKRLDRISPAAIDRIARKQLPGVRSAERERLRNVLNPKSSKNEEFEMFLEACERDTQPRKRYHMALEKNGSVKYDKRFKFFRKKLDESAEDLLAEISKLQEMTESFAINEKLDKDKDDPCWKNYTQLGMKKNKKGQDVPNCVPMESYFTLDEEFELRFLNEEVDLSEASLNDIVWSKNVIKPGSKKTSSKKYNPGDKVQYAGGISTVVKHDSRGFVTLSNPSWTKDRIVPHYSLKEINEGENLARVKLQIAREKGSDKEKHERMKDAAAKRDKNMKESATTVKPFVSFKTKGYSPKVPAHVKHELGIGVPFKHMIGAAIKARDTDNDGDVDRFDKSTPDEITGTEKKNMTKVMQKKMSGEVKHTKRGLAFEAVDKSDPNNREHGTDSLVKILKSDTPGQEVKEAALNDYIEKGARVRFEYETMTDGPENVDATVVGTEADTGRLRVRDNSGKLYIVKHQDVDLIEEYEYIEEADETCPILTVANLKAFEKFVDKMFEKYNIDFEFTKHFRERMSDKRNDPCISMKELAQMIQKIYKKYQNGEKSLSKYADSEAVIKDMQSDLNMPIAVEYSRKNDDLVVITKTIMRKKNFRTPSPEIKL